MEQIITRMEDYEKRRLIIGLQKAYADGRLKRAAHKPTPDGKAAAQVLVKQLSPEEKRIVAKAKAEEKARLTNIARAKREGRQPIPARCVRHYLNRKGEYYQVVIKKQGMREYRSQKFQHLNEAVKHRDKYELDYELSKRNN